MTLNYGVKLGSGPAHVIDTTTGQAVANSAVTRIGFDTITVPYMGGNIKVVNGPGKADIRVNGKSIKGVPLIST